MQQVKDYLERGEFDKVKQLITVENVNNVDEHGNGILTLIWYYNVSFADEDATVAFLRYCKSLGASPSVHVAPLHCACAYGCTKIVRELLGWCETDLDARDWLQRTPLDVAFSRRAPPSLHDPVGAKYDEELFEARKECAKLLLDLGASLAWNTTRAPRWAHLFLANKENCRAVCVVLLGGLTRGKSPFMKYNANVMPIIARCVWAMRGLQKRE